MSEKYYLCPDIDSVMDMATMLYRDKSIRLVVSCPLQLEYIRKRFESLYPDLEIVPDEVEFRPGIETPVSFYEAKSPQFITHTNSYNSMGGFIVQETAEPGFFLVGYGIKTGEVKGEEEVVLIVIPPSIVYISGEVDENVLETCLFSGKGG